MTKEEAKKIYEQKYNELQVARTQYNDVILKTIKEKYIGKFVKFSMFEDVDLDTDNGVYMFVEDIWGDPDENVYVEGAAFRWNISVYADETGFYWAPYEQYTFGHNSFKDDDFVNMKIITKEEYKQAFNKGIIAMTQEEENYEYNV